MAKKAKAAGPDEQGSREGYLHGYSKTEQERLQYQARFTEQSIYRNLDLSSLDRILEVGVGVGAQSEILLRRFPRFALQATL